VSFFDFSAWEGISVGVNLAAKRAEIAALLQRSDADRRGDKPATDLWQRRREMHAAMGVALWLPTHRTPVKMRRRLQRSYARYCSPESSPFDNTDLERAEAALREAGFHPEVYGRPAVAVEERCNAIKKRFQGMGPLA
jgi:hypothetical protein